MSDGYDAYVSQLEERRRQAPDGTEFWMARDLYGLLGYETWERFPDVISRAVEACKASDVDPSNHFRITTKMVNIGSGAKRETDDWFLSRYACYLIAMNADSRKEEVAHA